MENKLSGKQLFEKEKALAEYDGDDRIVSSHELAEDLLKTQDSEFIISTGVPSYDKVHEGGVEAGELIVVTGPTGEGKTTWLMSVTRNMVAKKVKSAWFSLEVTPRQFMKKIKKENEEDIPLFYLPKENREEGGLEWIEDRVLEAKVKHNVKVVFIDHLHQIFSTDKFNRNINTSIEIGDMVAKLKAMALHYNVVIFLIAHSKDPSDGSTREPRKEDIRDSGLISRLADSIVGVWRVQNDAQIKENRRKALAEDDIKSKVRVFKNRRTGILTSFFMYHENHYLSEGEEL